MKDFTIEKYEELLRAIKQSDISVYGVKKWQELKPSRGILLRHDVDRKAGNSLKIAETENKYNIQSTFYFRIKKSSFNEIIIKRIYELGHEIGYHYEDLSIAKGNYDQAFELFQKHLAKLRELVPVKTISMHGRPLSRYDNRDVWNKFSFIELGILGEAYLSINYEDTYYFTDTGRSWNPDAANLRDKVKFGLTEQINTTDELGNFIQENKDKKIAIVSHPERWARNMFDYYSSLSFDLSVNIIKGFIKIVRDDK